MPSSSAQDPDLSQPSLPSSEFRVATMSRREQAELVQVLAVGVASLECALFGRPGFQTAAVDPSTGVATLQGTAVLDLIAHERVFQDMRWPNQTHGRISWLMILAEEVGEWADELPVPDLSADVVYDSNGERLSSQEVETVIQMLDKLSEVGRLARSWLENHDWSSSPPVA